MRETAKNILIIFLFALVLTVSHPAPGSTEQNMTKDTENTGEAAPDITPDVQEQPLLAIDNLRPDLDVTFFYRLTGRPDPFMPFIEATRTATEEEKEELTGLRRFEPGQLTLTAIVISDRENIAMAEDSTGRGHFFRPGDAIGRKGRVEHIAPGLVIVQEPILTPTGETEYRTIEMILTQEGD